MVSHRKKNGNPRSVHRYYFPSFSSQRSLPEEQSTSSPQQIAVKYQALMEEGREAGFAEGIRSGLEQGQQLGQEKGFQAGLLKGQETGHQQAYEECKIRLDETQTQIEKLYNALEVSLQETQVWQKETLCRLVAHVCRQVLRAELALNPTQIMPLIEETLELLPKPHGPISIQLDPGTHALLQECAPEIFERWTLQPDPQLTPGSFHIQTGLATADRQLDDCVDLCVEQLRQQMNSFSEFNRLETVDVLPDRGTVITPQTSLWDQEGTTFDQSLPKDRLSDNDFRG